MDTLVLLLGISIVVGLVVIASLVGVTAVRDTPRRRDPDMTDHHGCGADQQSSGRRRRSKPSRTAAEDMKRFGRVADAFVQRLFKSAAPYAAPEEAPDTAETPVADSDRTSPTGAASEPGTTGDSPSLSQSPGPVERTAAISPYAHRHRSPTVPERFRAPVEETDQSTLALIGGVPTSRLRTTTVVTWLRPEGYVEWEGALFRARWQGEHGRFPAPGALVRVDVASEAEDRVLDAHPLP